MKATKADPKEPLPAPEAQLRRSTREKKEPKNDDYFMGSGYIEDIFGHQNYEDDCYPKRKRKNYRYDDSEDYFEGPRNNRKSKQVNANKVEALLEWRYLLDPLPITVNFLPTQLEPVPVEELHRVKFTKNIASQNLAAIAQDIQAVFINIDWGKKGQSLKDFQQLKLESTKFMAKGIVFVWAPKSLVAEMLTTMEKKDFVYVQNFEIINFDIEKAKQLSPTFKPNSKTAGMKNEEEEKETAYEDFKALVSSLENVDPCDLIAEQPSEYFNSSKRTLLMFKKNNNLKFELRHQRTCDVVFDMPIKLSEKCEPELKAYIYNMIETLLPDCLVIDQKKKNEYQFKMIELWADKNEYRRGWVSVVQE